MANRDYQLNARERNQETVHQSSNLIDDGLISLLLTPVESLSFSPRTIHLLEKYEINTVADLFYNQEKNLLGKRGIGHSTLSEIQEISQTFFLQLERNYSREYIEKALGRMQKIYFPNSSYTIEQSSSEINVLPISLESLPMSVRTINALLRSGIKSCEELLRTSEESLLQINNIGEKSIKEINIVKTELLSHSEKELIASEANIAITNETTKSNFRIPISIIRILGSFGINNYEDFSNLTEEDFVIDGGLSYLELINFKKYLSSIGVSLQKKWPKEALVTDDDYRFLIHLGVPLARIDISRLALPLKLEATLINNLNFFSIDALASQSRIILQAALFFYDNNSLSILERNIKLYFEWLPTQSNWDKEIAKSIPSPLYFLQLRQTSLEKIVEYFLAGISIERHKRIILLRFGLDEEDRITLEQVAERLSITRERVRQIESLAIGKIVKLKDNGLIQAFYYLIKEEMYKLGGIVSIDQFVPLIESFMEIGEIKLDGAISFLLYLEKDLFHEIERSKLWGLRGVHLELIRPVRRTTLDLLNTHYAPLSFSDLVVGIRKSQWYSDLLTKVALTDEFIKACISTDDRFEEVDNSYWALGRWKKSRVDDIVMALHKLGKPSHCTEITTIANGILPPTQKLSVRNCLAILGRKPDLFIWVRSGTYGLSEWGIKKVRFYVDIAEEYLEYRKEPLCVEDIYSYINKEREASIGNIFFMLSTNHRFSRYPNNKYGLANWIQETFNDAENDNENIEKEDPFLDDLRNKFFNDFQTDR